MTKDEKSIYLSRLKRKASRVEIMSNFNRTRWNKAPRWARFIAIDKDRRAFFYSIKPSRNEALWVPQNGEAKEIENIYDFYLYGAGWKDSLIQRPIKKRKAKKVMT